MKTLISIIINIKRKLTLKTHANEVLKCSKYAKSIIIPEDILSIKYCAFDDCTLLTSVRFEGTVNQWEKMKGKEYLFRYVPLKEVKCLDGVWAIPDILIPNGEKEFSLAKFDSPDLKSIVIPASVQKINRCECHHRKMLTFVEYKGTLKQWDLVVGKKNLIDWDWEYSFILNHHMRFIPRVPGGYVKCSDGIWKIPLLLIENGILIQCLNEKVKNIAIPDNTIEIGEYAFISCYFLHSVSIPTSVTKIGNHAFFSMRWFHPEWHEDYSSLWHIVFEGTVAQWKSIEKGNDWSKGVPAKNVKCLDGEVAL